MIALIGTIAAQLCGDWSTAVVEMPGDRFQLLDAAAHSASSLRECVGERGVRSSGSAFQEAVSRPEVTFRL
jgi:hypothetical protein